MVDTPEPPRYEGGGNIALKVPPDRFGETVRFYREVLGLPWLGEEEGSHRFRFGGLTLWIDRAEGRGRGEVWLELFTDDVSRSRTWLQGKGARLRDGLEPLGDLDAHWISDPAGIVHLVSKKP